MLGGMEEVSLGVIFMMGVAYGSSACLLSCSPVLIPFLVRNGDSIGTAARAVAVFSTGRVFAYSVVGAAAASASVGIRELLKDSQTQGRVMGAVMIATALYLFYRGVLSRKRGCSTSCGSRSQMPEGWLPLFGLGALFSLNLCSPLLALSSLSAAGGSVALGALYGAIFGLGSVAVAAVFYGFIFSAVAKELLFQFSRQRLLVEIFSSGMLLLIGLMVFNGRLIL